MKNELNRISLGIKYKRSFRIADIAGTITDYIINDESSPFPKNFFKNTSELVDGSDKIGRVLMSENGSTLTISIDNMVLTITTRDLDKSLEKIKNHYYPYLKKIFKEFKIKNIGRLGVLFEYEDQGKGGFKELFNYIALKDGTRQKDLFLRFSEREIDLISYTKRDLLDYVNNIVTVTRNEDVLKYKFDFQFYYKPDIESIEDVDINSFISKSKEKVGNQFTSWVKRYEKQK